MQLWGLCSPTAKKERYSTWWRPAIGIRTEPRLAPAPIRGTDALLSAYPKRVSGDLLVSAPLPIAIPTPERLMNCKRLSVEMVEPNGGSGILARPTIFRENMGQILPCQGLAVGREILLSEGERGSKIDSDFLLIKLNGLRRLSEYVRCPNERAALQCGSAFRNRTQSSGPLAALLFDQVSILAILTPHNLQSRRTSSMASLLAPASRLAGIEISFAPELMARLT